MMRVNFFAVLARIMENGPARAQGEPPCDLMKFGRPQRQRDILSSHTWHRGSDLKRIIFI